MPLHHNHDFRPLSRQAYFRELARRLETFGAGDTAALACMSFDPAQPAVQRIVVALCGAAQRGAAVHFFCDAINFLTHEDGGFGPLFYHATLPRRLPARYRVIQNALNQLRESGVQVTVLNMPGRIFPNPIAGRSHIKFALLNDDVYLGGCNLDYETHTDIMLRWSDTVTATWLRGVSRKLATHHSVRRALGEFDLRQDIDDQSTILLDIGRKKQSVILDEAIRLIDQAKDYIYLTTQYFPSHGTSEHLKRAHKRGVAVTLIYNDVRNTHRLTWLHATNFRLAQRRLPAELFQRQLAPDAPYMHAKILCTERAALIGSHNFVTPGVRLGTAEIALFRRNAAFAAGLRAWFEKQL